MTQNFRQRLGKWGERTAASYLTGRGYLILDNNCRTPYGEIDLITRIDNTIVFVEVKTRASQILGMPEISVSARKRMHMIQSAEYYIQQHPAAACTWRIDVIAIQRTSSEEAPSIMHFENAVA
jgi:putative endonuclease